MPLIFLPLPSRPTSPASGATFDSDWRPYFSELESVSRQNQALATEYASNQFLAAQSAPSTYSLDPSATAVVQQIADALTTIGKAMTTRIISSSSTVTVGQPWSIPTTLNLYPGSSFDLKTTLPTGVAANGKFDIVSASLPVGVTLDQSTGILAATATAVGSVSGLQFSYTF